MPKGAAPVTAKPALWLIAVFLVLAGITVWLYTMLAEDHAIWLDTLYVFLAGVGVLVGILASSGILIELSQRLLGRPPAPRPDAPSQAPQPLASFVGRKETIAALGKALRPGRGPAIVALTGLSGAGKTELAKQVVSQVSPWFANGVLWASCAYQDLTSVADQWAAAFGVEQLPGDDLVSKSAAWRGLLTHKEVLLIFDDVQAGQEVEPLFPSRGRSMVLLTTRQVEHPALQGITPVQLEQFTRAEATSLAQTALGSASARDQRTDAAGLFDHVSYLPLTLGIALATAKRNGWTLAALNQQLAEQGPTKTLDEPGLPKGLLATFNASRATLPTDLQRAFSLLAVFNRGPDFDTAAFSVILQADEAAARKALQRLEDAALLTRVGGLAPAADGPAAPAASERWSLHPLLRQFGAKLLPPEHPAWGRMAAHYLQVASAADALYQNDQITAGLALFDREWSHIQAGQEWAATRAQTDIAAARLCTQYPDTRFYCLALRLRPRQRIAWLQAAVAAAHRLRDKQAEAATLVHLGNAHSDMDDTQQAIEAYLQALTVGRQASDREGEGAALANLGLSYAGLGDARQAAGFFQQYVTIAREIGDREGENEGLANLGDAYVALGETQRARDCHQQRLAVAREIGDRQGEGATLTHLGLAYAALGETWQAIDAYQRALVIDREICDRRGEAADLLNLGLAYAALGEKRQAIDAYEQALAVDREIGDRQGESADLTHLGLAYADLGEPRQAITFHQQALDVDRAIDDRSGEAADLTNLGIAHAALGESRQAIDLYEQTLVVARDSGDRRAEGGALANIGLARKQLGDLGETRRLWMQALRIFETLGAPDAAKVRRWLTELGR